MTKSKTTQGFTLIELSIVIIITGVALAGAIEAYKIYSEKQKIENTKSVLAHIDQNLKDFPNTIDPTTADPNTGLGGSLYERLPCPDVDGDGREDCAMATVRGRRFDGAPNGPNVMVGALPYNTLGLAMDYATDPYGSPIIYAITQSAANATSFGTGIGAIQITDDDGNQTYTNQYVVVSTGRLGCGGDGADAENCDGDADFIAAFQTEGTGQYYDDRVIHNAQVPTLVNTDEPAGCEQVESFETMNDCPEGWSEAEGFPYTGNFILDNIRIAGLSAPVGLPTGGSQKYYNIDNETGDYYFTNVETNETVNTGGGSGNKVCTKDTSNKQKNKCFSKQVEVQTGTNQVLTFGGRGNTGRSLDQDLDNYCPDGWRALSVSAGNIIREEHGDGNLSEYAPIHVNCGQ